MKHTNLILPLITAVGLILVFPPSPMGIIAHIALVPLFFSIKTQSPKNAFKIGYFIGLVWAAGTIYWISWATVPGFIGSILYVPLFIAFFAMLQNWLVNRWGDRAFWAAPFIWTAVEIFSSWGSLAFTWNTLANTQTSIPVFIQFAAITGAFGISFWVVLTNVFFYHLIVRWTDKGIRFQMGILIVAGFLLPLFYGMHVLARAPSSEEKLGVSLIQGNIDPYRKWTPSFVDSNFVIYERLTQQAADAHPDLLIWPETAAPCFLRQRYRYLKQVKAIVDSLGIPLLTGAPDYERLDDGTTRIYNAALFIRPHSWVLDCYYKMKLVPFSERVPLSDQFPWLYNISRRIIMSVGNFTMGDSVRIFSHTIPRTGATVRFAVAICYDSVFPDLVRRFSQAGAQFLVIITNDGWFGRTSGPYQHARHAVLRAIENRMWVARCANTGISEFIDPYGRVQSKTGVYREAVLRSQIGLNVDAGHTHFVHNGERFVYVIWIVNFMFFAGTLMIQRRWPDRWGVKL